MTARFDTFDYLILIVYFLGTMGIGWWSWRKGKATSEEFTSGGRNLSGWLCGLSIFATFLSSITFLALPGAAYNSDWNLFVFSLSLPIAAWVAARWFLPYYRQNQDASAYAMLERRFGLWARWIASLLFIAVQLARMSFVMYLMALPLAIIFEWDIRLLITGTGVAVMIYATMGGIVAVIWADAIQAVVLSAGAVIALVLILYGLPNGVSDLLPLANRAEGSKFSLGTFDWRTWTGSAFWLVLSYGLFENLRNFGVDQNYIQRYVSAKPQEAVWSLWFGALLYVPVSALFLLIGSSLFAFYQRHPQDLQEVRRIVEKQQQPITSGLSMPREEIVADGAVVGSTVGEAVSPTVEGKFGSADESGSGQAQGGPARTGISEQVASATPVVKLGDRVFPHYIAKYLPPGIKGLLIAAIFSAAMSTISTSLNSVATIVLSDFYLRGWRPLAEDRQRLWVLRIVTVVAAVLAVGGAMALVTLTGSALDAWWTISSVLGTGILGLFLLGRWVAAAGQTDAAIGLLAGFGVVAALIFGQEWAWGEVFVDLKMSIVFGTIAVVGAGWCSSWVTRSNA